MIVTKVTVTLGVLGYLALWILAINGLSYLVPMLLIPLVLVVLIGLGAWLTRYMGVPTRSPRFNKPKDDLES